MWNVLEVYGMTGNFSGVDLEWMDRQKLLFNYNVQFLLLQVQPVTVTEEFLSFRTKLTKACN